MNHSAGLDIMKRTAAREMQNQALSIVEFWERIAEKRPGFR